MKALSDEVGAGPTYVRDILERNREPTIEKFSSIVKALVMSVWELLGDNSGAGPETFPVPVFDIRASAGSGLIAADG